MRDLHEDRKSDFRRLQWVGDNRRVQWIVSRHWHFRTFSNIHHRIHIYPMIRGSELLLHLSDLSGFVVSSENGESVSVPDFQSHKESHSFYWVVASVNVVSHKQVVGVRRSTTYQEFNDISMTYQSWIVPWDHGTDHGCLRRWWLGLSPAARSTLKSGFPSPKCKQVNNLSWIVMGEYLFAELFHFSLRERLALHESLNLLVQSRDIGHFKSKVSSEFIIS